MSGAGFGIGHWCIAAWRHWDIGALGHWGMAALGHRGSGVRGAVCRGAQGVGVKAWGKRRGLGSGALGFDAEVGRGGCVGAGMGTLVRTWGAGAWDSVAKCSSVRGAGVRDAARDAWAVRR